MKSYYMGVDIGTSSVRAVLYNEDGNQAGQASREYSIMALRPGWAEMDPDLLVSSVFSVIGSCVRNSQEFAGGVQSGRVCGVGISCQMHSIMAVGKDGRPLTPLMTWADTRAGAEARTIKENFDVAELYRKTGCRVQHPMYPLAKILWIKKNQPEVFEAAAKFITIKEYLLSVLFNDYIVDYTLASCQGYYNIHTQQWDDDILNGILHLTRDKFSTAAECSQILTGFNKEYENSLCLKSDTPFIIGSGDGILANIGSGVCDNSAFASTVGTSGAVRTTVRAPLLDDHRQTWCYSFLKDAWVAGGAINNGGLALKWLKDTFRQQYEFDASLSEIPVYQLFDTYASEISPASEGLIFLPYLTGERSPDWNADARGLMFGLSLMHGRKHIIRAAMEGVMYRMFSVYEALKNLSGEPLRILANGGYAKSRLWLQIQADLFDREVLVSGVKEASALGAAFLAMIALGERKGIDDLLPAMAPLRTISPSPEGTAVYRKAYARAEQVYQALYGFGKSDSDELLTGVKC